MHAATSSVGSPTSFDWNRVWTWLEGVENVRLRLEPGLLDARSGPERRSGPSRMTPSVDRDRGEYDVVNRQSRLSGGASEALAEARTMTRPRSRDRRRGRG